MKEKSILRKILGWVIYIIVLIVLIYGIPKAMVYVLDTPYPMAAITSGSMWPALKSGDMVLIKGVSDKGEVEVGDIIVYQNRRGFTIHRITKINDNSVITKGDANNTSDPAITYDQIIGKTVSFNDKPIRIPFLGSVSIFMNKHKING